MINENAQVQEAMSYLAYGAVKSLIQPAQDDQTRQKFTGKELDEDGKIVDGQGGIVCAGMMLNYFGARYYDSDIGLWTSTDPARQFWSPYSYGNNPINNIDPDGREQSALKDFSLMTAKFGLGTSLKVLEIKCEGQIAMKQFRLMHPDLANLEGNVDAFHHAFATVSFVKEFGVEKAAEILKIHEMGPNWITKQSTEERARDISNNLIVLWEDWSKYDQGQGARGLAHDIWKSGQLHADPSVFSGTANQIKPDDMTSALPNEKTK